MSYTTNPHANRLEPIGIWQNILLKRNYRFLFIQWVQLLIFIHEHFAMWRIRVFYFRLKSIYLQFTNQFWNQQIHNFVNLYNIVEIYLYTLEKRAFPNFEKRIFHYIRERVYINTVKSLLSPIKRLCRKKRIKKIWRVGKFVKYYRKHFWRRAAKKTRNINITEMTLRKLRMYRHEFATWHLEAGLRAFCRWYDLQAGRVIYFSYIRDVWDIHRHYQLFHFNRKGFEFQEIFYDNVIRKNAKKISRWNRRPLGIMLKQQKYKVIKRWFACKLLKGSKGRW